VVTPPDVVSQLALAIPMCLLYEVGILAARLVSKPVPKESAAVDPEKSAKTDTEMDAQMDAAEASFRNISGK
jgi:sec-independent protein translocase protein TatC